MKNSAMIFLLLALFLPGRVLGQIGIADPVTGNASINFYGRVIDQNGNPLAEVTIKLRMLVGYSVPPADISDRYDSHTLQTDASGNFSLTGVSGRSVEIQSIEKDGYTLSGKVARLYPYSWSANIFHPDKNKPVLFKMWKSQGKESLMQSKWNHKVSCDGTINRFDLATGHESQQGNLEIVCVRTPLRSPPLGNGPFDYSFEISVVGGGIQPTTDEFTFLAPESGYASRFTESKKSGEQGWRGRLTQEFYIKTAEGHYGRLSVDWYAAQNSPTHLDWNCSINRTGSRNLER